MCTRGPMRYVDTPSLHTYNQVIVTVEEASVQPTTLSDAAAQYLETQKEKDVHAAQRELSRFVQWCGQDRQVSAILPIQVEEYSATLEYSGDGGAVRLAITKRFLNFLRKHGMTETRLASFARIRRNGKRRAAAQAKRVALESPKKITAEGHKKLLEDLDSLKAERSKIAEEIRQAASTGDFSENSPLDAAREHQGQTEARIRELESILQNAVIMDGSSVGMGSASISVGSRVVLQHLQTGKEISYLLVEPSEADPSSGKLSTASPVGQAVLDRSEGDQVEVVTPKGAVTYKVTGVG